MDRIQQIAAKAIETGGKLRVRSALNPVLWLSGIVSVPALFAASQAASAPSWLIGLAYCPVITAILGFFFLLIFDRDKLQSEDYQIRKKSLELIEQKGDNAPMVIDPSRLDVVPKPNALPERIEEER